MSRLRITGGSAGGRWLREPVLDGVRPTSERMREAVFSIIGQDLDGETFLDACAGSGLMGIEAWSRGATVTSFEADGRIAASLKRRAAEVGAALSVQVKDIRHLREGQWTLAFVDPPYKRDPEPFLMALSGHVHTVYMEVASSRTPPQVVGALHLAKVRRYGDSALWTLTTEG